MNINLPANWYTYLAVLGVLMVAVPLLILVWPRVPQIVRIRSQRQPGLKGLWQRFHDWVLSWLLSQAKAKESLPEGFSTEKFLLVLLVAIVGGVLLMLWMGLPLLALLGGAVAGYLAATMYASAAARKRRQRLEAQIFAVTRILSGVMRGASVQALDVLRLTLKKIGQPLQEELLPLVTRTAAGEQPQAVLLDLQKNLSFESPLFVDFFSTLRECYRPAEDGSVSSSRQAELISGFFVQAKNDREVERTRDVLARPGRTTKVMVIGIILMIAVFQFVMQPDTMKYFVSITFGQVALVIVLLLIVVVQVLGERFSQIE